MFTKWIDFHSLRVRGIAYSMTLALPFDEFSSDGSKLFRVPNCAYVIEFQILDDLTY